MRTTSYLQRLAELLTGPVFDVGFEGCLVRVDRRLPIQPGDMYLAERNTGIKLLTCYSHNREHGYVIPVENGAYPYDTHECYRITHIDGEPV